MTDANTTLQTAIYTALTGDATLMASVTGVFDDVPPDQAFPHIELADVDSVDYGTKTTEGLEHFIEVHVWSNYHGQKEIFDIMRLVDDVLHDQTLSLTGHTLVNIRRESRVTVRDIDPQIRHGIMRYRCVTERN